MIGKGIICTVCLLICGAVVAQNIVPQSPLLTKQGVLLYNPDSQGNQIPDFSHSGYRGGDEPIAVAPIRAVVEPTDGDATASIQQAIDYVGGLKPDKSGFRGAVLLRSGSYNVTGAIKIAVSGVVLRGSGVGANGTKIIATGRDRRTLITVLGEETKALKDTVRVDQQYVAVGSMVMEVSPNHGLQKGDKIFVVRPSTAEWIKELGTDDFGGGSTYLGWKPSQHNITWDRTVVSVSANRITVDAPITTALDRKFGGGHILPYSWNGRIKEVGIENLECISDCQSTNPKDEAHAWTGVTIDNATDCWVRNIIFTGFAGSAVAVLGGGSRITVENCKSLSPVSEIGGGRRNTFITWGQQCLFQMLYSQDGYHDFAVGYCAAGPNVFLQCHAERPHSFSGSTGSWASGVLFDIVNIDGNAISFKNLMQQLQGTGWNAANSVMWQCSASLIECFSPPTACNWSFGSWAEFSGNGIWNESNNHVNPRSLYYAQLKQRLGAGYTDRTELLPIGTEASSSPQISVAMELTKKAQVATPTLENWIDSLIAKSNLPTQSTDAKLFRGSETAPFADNKSQTEIRNGWITHNGGVITGQTHNVQWWSGTVKSDYLKKGASPHITRFVPNRTGTGLTDNLNSVVQWMGERGVVAIDHNYGLWYDRRRDDHQRVRRINSEVWAPFYEQPFARSGEGVAADGLSRYDLTKYNDWYWDRLSEFARIGDSKGVVLMHQNYFQHNIIEAGAHWTDSPWRPANNINNTEFPEPVPYAGDKRIFLAEQFYDTTNVVRNGLHRAFINKCMDNFRGQTNVVQLLSEEYTGPLHFMEFWLDVVADWEKQNNQQQTIALSATKEVQDAILADPVRSKVVEVIDIRYWFYRNDGSQYAPLGGQNLAPRQHARIVKPGKASFESVYRAVSEYSQKYPDKAVTYYADSYVEHAWAVFMGGGSMAAIPRVGDLEFGRSAAKMKVIAQPNNQGRYLLGDQKTGYIVYTTKGSVDLDFTEKSGRYALRWVDPLTGAVSSQKRVVRYGETINNVSDQAAVAWLIKL